MIPGENQFWFPVGPHRVLFVDDMYVARSDSLSKKLHQPVRHPANPLIFGERPWEEKYVIMHGSLLLDPTDDTYKCWYHANGCCYAESPDGLEWHKPSFDIFPWEGENSNIVYKGFDPELLETRQFNLDNISILIRPEDPDPGRRYRLFTFQAPLTPEARERYQGGYGQYIAYSPDGINWSSRKEPVLTKVRDDPAMSDCHTCLYDSLNDRYIAFTKRHVMRPDGTGDQGVMQRARGISFSEDFENWTKPRTCLVPDDCDDRSVNFYDMSGFVYEGMYLGLLEVYYSSDDHPTLARTRDVQLVSSRDGENWWRAGGRESFLSPTGVTGDWEAFMLDIQSGPPILKGDELRIYYGGRARHHVPGDTLFPEDRPVAAIGLAVLRRDGFVSYEAGRKEGELVTKPVMFEKGSTLHVNADIRGGMRVEVLEVKEGEAPRTEPVWRLKTEGPFEGFTLDDCRELSGDRLDGEIRWAGENIGRLQGKPVALRFVFREASFYSFWIV